MAMMWIVAALASAAVASPAIAQAQRPCPADAEPVPAALAGWKQGTALAATASIEGAPTIAIGRAAEVMLGPSARLRPVTPPARAAAADSHGGIVAFSVARAGTYRVALAAPAWIDVVAAGTPVTSTAHGHGPRCSGMRKIVDFALRPGRHLIQLTGSPAASVRVLVVAAR